MDARYWNCERKRLGGWRRMAACVAYGVLEVLALLFAFVSLAAFLAALCV